MYLYPNQTVRYQTCYMQFIYVYSYHLITSFPVKPLAPNTRALNSRHEARISCFSTILTRFSVIFVQSRRTGEYKLVRIQAYNLFYCDYCDCTISKMPMNSVRVFCRREEQNRREWRTFPNKSRPRFLAKTNTSK